MNDEKKVLYQSRSIGRSLAFQALFQNELNPGTADDRENWENTIQCNFEEANVRLKEEMRSSVLDFARLLYEGVVDRRAEIDRVLNEALDKRTLSHTTPVDRCILRLATYEIRFVKTPKAVVISEAIELGKKFGDSGSRAFLNGVLDQVDKIQLQKDPCSYVVVTSETREQLNLDSVSPETQEVPQVDD